MWDPIHRDITVGEVFLWGAVCNVALFYAIHYDWPLFASVLGVLAILFWAWVFRGAFYGFMSVARVAYEQLASVGTQ